MHDPQGQLLLELGWGCDQKSIAMTYAFIMRQEGDKADWPRINQAIRERWPAKGALNRIKVMAWKFAEGMEI